jgi:hypothetical protein
VTAAGSVTRERCWAEVLRRFGDWGMVAGAQNMLVRTADRGLHLTASLRLWDAIR